MGSAASQEFRAGDGHLSRVSLYLASAAATGRITVEVRRTREDAGSAVASRTLNLAQLGGAGAGWLEIPLDSPLRQGAAYHLVAQAATSDAQAVTWYGTRRPAEGAPLGWSRDANGGWHSS